MQKTTLKNWSEDDQPIKKLIKNGRKQLTDVELLTIIIGKGNKNASAFELAQQIYESVNGKLDRLANLPIQHLMKVKGIGEQKSAIIFAALEFGMRRIITNDSTASIIRSSNDAYRLFRPLFMDLKQEHAYCMSLNRRNQVIQIDPISIGGMTSTVVDPKIVFQKALANNSCALILGHNHPSGSIKPSEQDIRLTKNIQDFGKMIDLPLLDHLILTDNAYFSLADEGYM